MKKYALYLLVFLSVMHNVYAMDVLSERQRGLAPSEDLKCYLVAKYVCTYPERFKEDARVKINSFFGQERLNRSWSYADWERLPKQVDFYKQNYEKIQGQAQYFQDNLLELKIKAAYDRYCYHNPEVRYELAYRYKDTPFALLLNGGDGIVCLDTLNEMIAIKAQASNCAQPGVTIEVVNDFEENMLAMYAHGDEHFVPKVDVRKSGMVADKITSVFKDNPHFDPTAFTVQKFFNFCQNNVLKFVVRKDEQVPSYDRESWRLCPNDADDEHVKIVLGLNFILKVPESNMLLLKNICAGSTAGKNGDIDKRYKVTRTEQTNLGYLHQELNDNPEWQVLQKAAVGVDFLEAPWFTKLKDKILLAIPLGLVDGLIPWGIYQVAHGKLQGLLGAVACGATGWVVGNNVFPWMDSYHSDVRQLSGRFGTENIRKIKRGRQFAFFAVMHYALFAAADRFMASKLAAMRYVAWAIHALQAGICCFTVFDKKTDDAQESCHPRILFGHMNFSNPLLRRNKEDKAYTLGDLVNASSAVQQ